MCYDRCVGELGTSPRRPHLFVCYFCDTRRVRASGLGCRWKLGTVVHAVGACTWWPEAVKSRHALHILLRYPLPPTYPMATTKRSRHLAARRGAPTGLGVQRARGCIQVQKSSMNMIAYGAGWSHAVTAHTPTHPATTHTRLPANKLAARGKCATLWAEARLI